MRIPRTPPTKDISEVINDLGIEKFGRHLQAIKPVDGRGRYLHWDEIRFRPIPSGLAAEQYWAILEWVRQASQTTLPFRDKSGNAFWYCETNPQKRQLHLIDSQLKGAFATKSLGASKDEAKLSLQRSLIEEPFSSSVLEGAATTRARARELVAKGLPPRTRDERMVLNNFRALEFVKSLRKEPLTPAIILEIQRIVTTDTLDKPDHEGRWRTENDVVEVVDNATGDILHYPPPAREITERIERLCNFANATESDDEFFHPMVRAILLHFQLAYIHPFADGNGRTARALFYWSALNSDYWLLEYVSISSVINRAPVKYGEAFLKTEIGPPDVTYFIDHQLQVLVDAISELQAYLDRQKSRLENFDQLIRGQHKQLGLNLRQTGLLNDLVRKSRDSVTLTDYQKIFDVSYITARNDLEALTQNGFLRKSKDGRTSIYALNEKAIVGLLED